MPLGFFAGISPDRCSSHEQNCDALPSKRSICTETDVDVPRPSVPPLCDALCKFAFVLSIGELYRITIDATSRRNYGNNGWGKEIDLLINGSFSSHKMFELK